MVKHGHRAGRVGSFRRIAASPWEAGLGDIVADASVRIDLGHCLDKVRVPQLQAELREYYNHLDDTKRGPSTMRAVTLWGARFSVAMEQHRLVDILQLPQASAQAVWGQPCFAQLPHASAPYVPCGETHAAHWVPGAKARLTNSTMWNGFLVWLNAKRRTDEGAPANLIDSDARKAAAAAELKRTLDAFKPPFGLAATPKKAAKGPFRRITQAETQRIWKALETCDWPEDLKSFASCILSSMEHNGQRGPALSRCDINSHTKFAGDDRENGRILSFEPPNPFISKTTGILTFPEGVKVFDTHWKNHPFRKHPNPWFLYDFEAARLNAKEMLPATDRQITSVLLRLGTLAGFDYKLSRRMFRAGFNSDRAEEGWTDEKIEARQGRKVGSGTHKAYVHQLSSEKDGGLIHKLRRTKSPTSRRCRGCNLQNAPEARSCRRCRYVFVTPDARVDSEVRRLDEYGFLAGIARGAKP